ncbi:MAG: right-handed parallel beta-helix repeat-containing protein [Candidatus Bathyarchaeota archaeon]|nr:right-handed parallel beta-helix repeat-containing protein [Candidatus Bathyarchaeota archaeon]
MGVSPKSFVLLLILCFTIIALTNVKSVKAEETICITSDGTIVGTDKILLIDNCYTFIDNINGSLEVQKNDAVINGAGYTLHGTIEQFGIRIEADCITVMNLVLKGFRYGVFCTFSSCNLFSNNTISETSTAIHVSYSSGANRIIDNYLFDNGYGININYLCHDTEIIGNTITANSVGLRIYHSTNNLLRNNTMLDNKSPFIIECTTSNDPCKYLHFKHDVDLSNTIDGKPIYYWLDHHNSVVPSDAGYVVVVNSNNITVQNFVFNNGQQVLFACTNSSLISNNHVANSRGIVLWESFYNIVDHNSLLSNSVGISIRGSENALFDNYIANCSTGISLSSSLYNRVFNNLITNASIALNFDYSQQNRFYKNHISNNEYGVLVWDSSKNVFYQNNFINNDVDVYDPEEYVIGKIHRTSSNTYYSNSTGNYWDTYTGEDNDNNGIGDTLKTAEGKDKDLFPLMEPVDIVVIPEFPSWMILFILTAVATIAIIYRKSLKCNSILLSA